MTHDPAPAGVFFAYPGRPALRGETLREASALTSERFGIPSRTWEHLEVEGRLIVGRITSAIDESAALIADIGELNSNVLFEVGYALSRAKTIWIVVDESDDRALRAWSDLGLLRGVGRVDYGGDSERLALSVAESEPHLKETHLWDELLTGAHARDPRSLFYTGVPAKFKAARDLDRLLVRRRDLILRSSDGDDLGLAPLKFYATEIYRSTAGMVHMLAPHRTRATLHNARASLLAGIAHGLELPLLMLAEEGFVPPLDYQDLLYSYPTSRALQDHVNEWLDGLPEVGTAARRPGRLHLQAELPIRDFGQYVAEYEADELAGYFISTGEFQKILRGGSLVFVGRKGTGKTANMLQAAVRLREDKRNLVVVIKPSSYELEGLLAVLRRLGQRDLGDYFLESLWKYLLYTEVASEAIRQAEARPAGIAVDSHMDALRHELADIDIRPEDDFAIRFETVVANLQDALTDIPTSIADTQGLINERLHANVLVDLRKHLGRALTDKQRVAVLVDNLDKAWEKGSDYPLLSRLILALLTAVGKVERDFQRKDAWRSRVNLSLTVFVRADIYGIVAEHAREPDKISALQIEWRDPELLARVIEDRYAAARGNDLDGSAMWEELFEREVHGLPTRDYLLWRALPRPRDIVYLANAALTVAVNRRHQHVSADDVILAEKSYSQFAFDALVVESDATGFDFETGLYEFAGTDSTMLEPEVLLLLESTGEPSAAVTWLTRASFLGLEVGEEDFEYVQGDAGAKRARVLARRLAETRSAPSRVRVHPAFRPYLEIRDDDLH